MTILALVYFILCVGPQSNLGPQVPAVLPLVWWYLTSVLEWGLHPGSQGRGGVHGEQKLNLALSSQFLS